MFGVSIGGILGHALCTALAVIGGRMIAQRISARTGEILHSTPFHITLIPGVAPGGNNGRPFQTMVAFPWSAPGLPQQMGIFRRIELG